MQDPRERLLRRVEVEARALWNDDQKDLSIGWAQILVGIGNNRVALVDTATLDATAVHEALRRQARVKKMLKERGDY